MDRTRERKPGVGHPGNEIDGSVADDDPPTLLAAGAAAVVLGFTWAKLLGVPWLPLTIAVPVVVVAWWIARRSRAGGGMRAWLSAEASWLGFGLIVLMMAVRLWPLRGVSAPAGGDMSMHVWLARIATEHAVLPDAAVPLYPEVPYGIYPLGFHGLMALVARDPDRLVWSGHVVTALAQTLFAGAVFRVLRSFTGSTASFATALATVFILRDPQAYVGWGGNPCVLGAAFAIFAWRETRECLVRATWPRVVKAASFAAATALTHPTAALTLAVVLVITVLVRLVGADRSAGLRAAALVGTCSLLFAAPAIVELTRVEFSQVERSWVQQHHLTPPQSPPLTLSLLPDYWRFVFGDATLVFGGLGLAAGLAKRRYRRCIGAAVVLVLAPYAIVWYRHSGLPLALALYPERVMLALVVPWAILLSCLADAAGQLWRSGSRGRRIRSRAAAVLLASSLLAAAVVNGLGYYGRAISGAVVVDDLDTLAFDEIRAVASASTVVANRSGDAAAFLPGLWGIASTHPQWNPVWIDELETWRSRHAADFRYERHGCGDGRLAAAAGRPGQTLFVWFTAGVDTVSIWRVDAGDGSNDQ